MFKKILLHADAKNLKLLDDQLQLIGEFRRLAVDYLLADLDDFQRMVGQYKLMGQVKAIVAGRAEFQAVYFKCLIGYAYDLCNQAQTLGRSAADLQELYQHRESLLYQDEGFDLHGTRLVLQLGQKKSLTLTLKVAPPFAVRRSRVYRWAKDGQVYGTFMPATVKPEASRDTEESVSDPVKKLLAKMRQAQRGESKVERVQDGLERLARQQLDWFRLLATQLDEQAEELATLRAELKRQRTLPWLN